MKNLFVLLTLKLIAVYAIGQIPFAPLGAKWYYEYVPCPNGPPGTHFVNEVTEDSMILGKSCTLIKSGSCYINASCLQKNYVYQEGEKVYFYEPDFNTFQMIYDFSLQAGESYKIKICQLWDSDSITVVVDSADTDIEGFQYLRILATNQSILNGTTYKIKKGVGGLNRNPLLLPEDCVFTSENCDTTNLLCYETPSSGIINISGSFCEPSSISEISKSNLGFKNYPNPASGYVKLSWDVQLSKNIIWHLYDQLGREVRRAVLSVGQQEVQVSVGDVVTGLYFWNVESEGRQLGNGKLIIIK